jgi:hypothetical protein
VRALVAGLVIAPWLGCDAGLDPVPEVAPGASAPESEVAPSEAGHWLTWRFEGRWLPLESRLDLRLVAQEGARVNKGVPQAGWCPVTVVNDGVAGTNPPQTLELVTDQASILQDLACFGGSWPAMPPGAEDIYAANRALCADVTVRSFFAGTVLEDVHAVIDTMDPATGHDGYRFPLGTGAQPPPGANAPSDARGLWSHGTLSVAGQPGDASERTWIFQRATDTEARFTGRIVARVLEDCSTPVDDNCDGRANEGCGLYPPGAGCLVDADCATAFCDPATERCGGDTCSNGVLDGGETGVDCGGACAPCADFTACAVNSDCASGACGLQGASTVCLPAARPVRGEVLLTEFMADGGGTDGNAGEWLELHNPSTRTTYLGGCSLEDAGIDFALLPPLTMAPGAYVTVGRSQDTTLNGGLTHAATYPGFVLGNGGDTIRLRCDGSLVFSVSYGPEAVTPGTSWQLEPTEFTADGSEGPRAFCPSTTVWPAGGGRQGTPAAGNTSCNLAGVWCRIQFPTANREAPEGSIIRWYARVFVAGLTDQSTGNNPHPRLVGQAGFMREPASDTDFTQWTWFDGAPFPGWVPFASPGEDFANEQNNDEYFANVVAPAYQPFDNTLRVAWRFSGDGGTTWTYCDRNTGPGQDGSQDGFQLSRTPTVQVTPPLPIPDAPGQVRFSEVMPQPALGDVLGEWIEIWNPSDTVAWNLNGCILRQQSPQLDWQMQEPIVLQPSGTVLLARNSDPARNGQLPSPDHVYFDINLRTTSERIELVCGGVIIDAMAWSGGISTGRSLQVVPGALALGENGPDARCVARDSTPYGASGRFGTPRGNNVDCIDLSYCRLQFPASLSLTAGSSFDAFVRIYGLGLTDQSPLVDPNPFVRVQAALMNVGDNNPGAGAYDWVDALPSPGYGPGSPGHEPNNDEYAATLAIPAAATGSRIFGFRASRDGGRTWPLYCDREVGGSNGSVDGWQAANAGSLTILEPAVVTSCSLFGASALVASQRGAPVPVSGFIAMSVDPPPPLDVQIGYGPSAQDPSAGASPDWVWTDASLAPFGPAAWQPSVTLTAPSAGGNPWAVLMRHRANSGAAWSYCGVVPVSEFSPFSFADDRGTLTVTPLDLSVSWFNIQWPPSLTLWANGGGPASAAVYQQLWIQGRTDTTSSPFTHPDLVVQLGVGPSGVDPRVDASAWHFITSPFNAGYNFGQNNDEYETFVVANQPPLSTQSTTSYRYVTRVSGDGGTTWTYRGGSGGSTTFSDWPLLTINR